MLPGMPEQRDNTLGETNCVGHFEQQIDPAKQLLMLSVNFGITYLENIGPWNLHIKLGLKLYSSVNQLREFDYLPIRDLYANGRSAPGMNAGKSTACALLEFGPLIFAINASKLSMK